MMEINIGDTVWLASYEYTEQVVPCPICFGKKEVQLILGDGSVVALPCGYCAVCYDAPRGTVVEHDYMASARTVTIDRIETNVSSTGVEMRYFANGSYFDAADLCATKEGAMTRAAEKAAEAQRERNARAEFLKKDAHKSFAWNAGCHRREAKELRKRADGHDEYARLCKERARESE